MEGCPSCRELTVVCRTLSQQLPGTEPHQLLAHVQVRHLDRWTRARETMPAHLDRMMKIEVPIIVLMGEKATPLHEVVSMMPGTIIDLCKPADSELEYPAARQCRARLQ